MVSLRASGRWGGRYKRFLFSFFFFLFLSFSFFFFLIWYEGLNRTADSLQLLRYRRCVFAALCRYVWLHIAFMTEMYLYNTFPRLQLRQERRVVTRGCTVVGDTESRNTLRFFLPSFLSPSVFTSLCFVPLFVFSSTEWMLSSNLTKLAILDLRNQVIFLGADLGFLWGLTLICILQ